MNTTHQIGDRVKVLHNIPLGNLIGTVKAIYERPGHDLYEVELDGGGIDKLHAFQMEPLVSPPETDDEIEEFVRAHDAGELPKLPPINTAKLMARVCLLEDALKDANGMCRSAMAIAERDGSANWPAFRDRLRESLERQHAVMYPSQREDAGLVDEKPDGQAENDQPHPVGRERHDNEA